MPRCSDMAVFNLLDASRLPACTRAAVFLDFDGTLVDLAPTPDSIAVPDALDTLLSDLSRCLEGAIALVSGRSVSDIVHHLPGYTGIIVGGHGAEWRVGAAVEPRVNVNSDGLSVLTDSAHAFAENHPGTLLERKPTGAVLHYRSGPTMKSHVEQIADELVAQHPEFEAHPAKMAMELRPKGVGKDKALADLMAMPPFKGRTPLMIGDDTTDEPALIWAQARGGLGIKVGEGDSQAHHRLADPNAVRTVLTHWAKEHRTCLAD
ncbi:trehalose-phosphatase [uncultured Tateyamaria sp.]|uniref:trehalose-phosphatase n=2 Tax=uncultured Tateyamaria sp. TaxID=455651 RepID=UPI00260369D8|nr:trehalose-phosphatase [uncultured Tateyamaria sp.]